jgi:hypothetical protein
MREAVADFLRPRAPSRTRDCGSGPGALAGAGRCIVSAQPSGRPSEPARGCCRADGDVLYVRLPADSATARQVWDTASVTVVATGLAGRPVGPTVEMSARIVSLEDEERVERAFSRALCRAAALFGGDPVYLELKQR